MQNTTPYYVNGELVYIPDDELDDFMAESIDTGVNVEQADSFWMEDNGGTAEYHIPQSKSADFLAEAERRGVRTEPMKVVQMDDGAKLTLGMEDLRQLVQAQRQGLDISRGMLRNTDIPEQYGRSKEERAAIARRLGDLYSTDFPESDEERNARELREAGIEELEIPNDDQPTPKPKDDTPGGFLDYMKTAKEAEYGRNLNGLEATAANLPFAGSVMDSNEKRTESVEKRLYSGDFRDSLEASKLALSIGIPQEEVKRVNSEAGGDDEAMRKGFASLVRDQLANRIETRQSKGEKLDKFDLNLLQEAGAGAAGLVKTVTEMASPAVASATIGPSMMNRAAGLNSGEWKVDENGNPIQTMTGDGGDLSMMKGLGGALAERAIWMNPWMGKWAGAVAKKSGGSMVANNAAQIVDMTLKNDLSDLVDNVVGLNKSEAETNKNISDWAEEHFMPQNLLKDIVHSAVAHVGMKGMRLATKGGRESLSNEIKAEIARRGEIEAQKQEKAAVEEEKRQARREVARETYDATMSDEAAFEIDAAIDAQIKAGTISEAMRDKVKERVLNTFENRRSLDDADLREGAVINAVDAVNAELATPERVTSPALERRQTEAKMKANEAKSARRDKEMADYEAGERTDRENELNRQGAEINADIDAQNAAHDKRKADIKHAFNKADDEAMKQAYAERKAAAKEWERAEAERKAREEAEQNAPEPVETKPAPVEGEATDLRDSPEYKEWLRKSGRNDTDKNWNRYVGEMELDPALRVDRNHNGPNAEHSAEAEMGQRIEQAGETQRSNAEAKEQAAYDAAATAREEAKGQAGHDARQADLEAAFADWKDTTMKKTAAQKKGSPVKEETPTETPTDERQSFADFCKGDKILQALDKEYRAATKAIDKGDVEYRVRERITELRDEWAKRNAKPTEPPRTGELARPQSPEPIATDSAKSSQTEPAAPVAEPTPDPVAAKPAKATNPKAGGRATKATDAAFRAWAVDRNGKPIEFATKADEKASRDLFDSLVKQGKLDPKTGKLISAISTAGADAIARQTEEYPTIVDKSGKRRLTGIAAERKAAADEESAFRKSFIENESPRGMMAFLLENGRLMGKPSKKKITDPRTGKVRYVYDDQIAGDALDNFFDGMSSSEKTRWERRLFGSTKNANASQTKGDGAIDAIRQYMEKPNMSIDKALDLLRKEYEAFDEFKKRGGKTSEQMHDEYLAEQAKSREVKIDGDYYDIEEIASKKEHDAVYDNAVVEVDRLGEDSPHVEHFSKNELSKLTKGDTIRLDHSEADFTLESYDPKKNEIVVEMKDIADNPLFTDAEKAEMSNRRFRITENGWIELNERNLENGNERTNAKGTDENLPRNAKGESAKPFSLESATAEQLADEQKRIADRKEIERRLNAPLKTGKGETGQDLLDLGGAEGEDLFNRVNNRNDATPAKQPASPVIRPTAATTAAQKLLKEKFYQSSADLQRQLKALPAQAPKELRAAYETAISAAKRRNAETRQIAEETVSMRANDPKRRSRAEVLAWAKSKGRQIVNGMVTPDGMREYDAQTSKNAAKVIKRLFTDMEIVSYDKAPELGGDGKRIEMRNKHGNTLGWFEPTSKRVVLLPGADAETVAHEIGWHAVRDWAKRNNPKLFDKMREVEDNVDPALRAKVLHIYRSATGYTRDMLLNEFGAFTFMGRGGKELEQVVATRDGAKWYAKMLNAAKDVYKDFVTKHGGNRMNLENIDAMDGEEFMNHMAKEIANGKSFGEIGAPKPATKPLSTDESFTDRQKRVHYDIGSVFRSIGKDIEKNGGGKKNAATEVDEAFGLKPGEQEAASIRVKAKSNELKELYAKHGISHEDFSYYMACKAAAGRDAKIDARNIKELQADAVAKLRKEWGSERIAADPEGFKAASDAAKADVELAYNSSNGSNISPSEAAKTIREWESGDMAAKTADLRKAWREIIDNTLQMQKDAGLISEKQYNEWKSQEKDYVPFKSPIDEATGEYVGRGATNFLRPEHMTAKGRKTAAGDVLSHAMVDWQTTENRVIENRLREKLAKLVEAHPELGTVEKVGRNEVTEKKTRDDFKDGKIIRDDGGDPNVVLFKRNGETYAIRLNGSRGTAMAAAITGRNLTGKWANKGVTMPKWLGGKKITFRSATRAWAATATSLSPTFAIRNTIKDNIELANIVFTEMGPVKGSKFAANYVKNRESNHLAIMKYITTGKIDASSPSGKVLQDFINDGGMIGGMGREGYADFAKQFSAGDISKMMKTGHNRAMAVGKHVLKSVSYLTEWSELATRVNAYAAAKSVGMNGKEAALWSRRAVTDFNRHGEWTGTTNVLRMFSNSTLGATARAAKSFTTSKYGIMSAAALLAKGYLGAMLEEAMNDESDERAKKTGEASTMDVSEFDRQNSALLIRNGDKEYRVPAHESFFSMLSYAGNCLRRVQTGKMTAKQMAKELGLQSATMMANLSGLGSVNLDSQDGSAMGMFKAGISSAVPSLLQPIVEILTNTDYAGRQVYREQYPGETSPRAERGRKNTPEFYKMIARKLNEYTGGNKARSGFADFNPEVIQKMFEGAGKNLMKDAVTAYMTVSAALNGEFPKLDVKNTFAKRDFVRTVSDSTPRFFNTQREAQKDIDEWKKLKGEMTSDERRAYLADHPWCREGVQERLRLLENGSRKSGVLGINSLRHLVDGKTYDGKERKTPATDEQIESWREQLRRKQAKYIELTTKR